MTESQRVNPEQTARWNEAAGQAWVEMQSTLDGMLAPFNRLLIDHPVRHETDCVLDIGCGAGSISTCAGGGGADREQDLPLLARESPRLLRRNSAGFSYFCDSIVVDDIHQRADTSRPRMEIVMPLSARKIEPEESMEARIARLEATTEHIQSDVKDLRQDVKEIRQQLKNLNKEFGTNLEELRKEMLESFESIRIGRVWDRVWMLLAMGAFLGVIARGFKWI